MTAPDDVDLDRVWTNVAAEVWRRHPGRHRRSTVLMVNKSLLTAGCLREGRCHPSMRRICDTLRITPMYCVSTVKDS